MALCVGGPLESRAQSAVATTAEPDSVHARYSDWAVDPADAGPDLPPAGRSLFDRLIVSHDGSYEIPYPLRSLLAQLARRAQCAERKPRDCYRAVLIPLGRSLQRRAAADGEYFRYPRAVFAFTGEASVAGAPLAKDRLYIGYHEAAATLEVISYNEASARFEFQIVDDYAAGSVATVRYANRAICTACHQNHAPIFSRQVWDETNANPAIAARLLQSAGDLHGVDVERGVDIPQAIDNAVARANRFAAYQRLWQRGCGANDAAARHCRAGLLTAALQHALSAEHGFDNTSERWRRQFTAVFAARWQAHWPRGLALASAEIPNRDPLLSPQTVALAHVPAAFETLLPRAPALVLQRDEARPRLVAGIAAMGFTRADVLAINRALDAQSGERRRLQAPCLRASPAHAAYRVFECGDAHRRLRLRVRVAHGMGGELSGRIENVMLPDGTRIAGIDFSAPQHGAGDSLAAGLTMDGLPARAINGERIESIAWKSEANDRGRVELVLRNDFAAVDRTLSQMADDPHETALADAPFERNRVLRALLSRLGWPLSEKKQAVPPPAFVDQIPAADADPPGVPFHRYCAVCHRTRERAPPAFLQGDVAHNIAQCAERIYVRLAMWSVAPGRREKTPMPPEIAARGLHGSDDWAGSTALAAMKTYVASTIPRFDESDLLARPYESLRECMPR
jgi:hypothetical protein